MGRVTENLARTGLKAACVVADMLDWAPDTDFDAILLDAPCTATGTIRRHPDLPFAKAEVKPDAMFSLQARMIDKAVTLLAPGGRMVFCTCSLLPEEGEDQADKALARHPSLSADLDALALPGVSSDWIGRHGLRLRPDYWPEHGGMDGFYIAVFQKRT